jgi:hypothetical protein
MSDEGRCAAAAVALERMATALAKPDVENCLQVSLRSRSHSELPAVYSLSDEVRRAVRVEVQGAHGALLRCRRLGSALDSFVRISVEAQGRGEYGPRADRAVPRRSGAGRAGVEAMSGSWRNC